MFFIDKNRNEPKIESGRSLLEIIAVIAIIGLLGITAINGYDYVTNKGKAHNISKMIATLITETRSALAGGRSTVAERKIKGPYDQEIIVKDDPDYKKYFGISTRTENATLCKELLNSSLIEADLTLVNGRLNGECPGEIRFLFRKDFANEATRLTYTDAGTGEERLCPAHSVCSKNGFTCLENYYRNSDECIKCPEHATCEEGASDFVCDEGWEQNEEKTSCVEIPVDCSEFDGTSPKEADDDTLDCPGTATDRTTECCCPSNYKYVGGTCIQDYTDVSCTDWQTNAQCGGAGSGWYCDVSSMTATNDESACYTGVSGTCKALSASEQTNKYSDSGMTWQAAYSFCQALGGDMYSMSTGCVNTSCETPTTDLFWLKDCPTSVQSCSNLGSCKSLLVFPNHNLYSTGLSKNTQLNAWCYVGCPTPKNNCSISTDVYQGECVLQRAVTCKGATPNCNNGVCEACTGEKSYSAGENATSCSTCPTGKKANSDHTGCIDCEIGDACGCEEGTWDGTKCLVCPDIVRKPTPKQEGDAIPGFPGCYCPADYPRYSEVKAHQVKLKGTYYNESSKQICGNAKICSSNADCDADEFCFVQGSSYGGDLCNHYTYGMSFCAKSGLVSAGNGYYTWNENAFYVEGVRVNPYEYVSRKYGQISIFGAENFCTHHGLTLASALDKCTQAELDSIPAGHSGNVITACPIEKWGITKWPSYANWFGFYRLQSYQDDPCMGYTMVASSGPDHYLERSGGTSHINGSSLEAVAPLCK